MMQIIYCKNCDGSSIPLNGIYINVELIKSVWCDGCQNSKKETQQHFFCSVECFNDYMKTHDINWTL